MHDRVGANGKRSRAVTSIAYHIAMAACTVAALVSALEITDAWAVDQVLPFPAGWTAEAASAPFSLIGGNLAIAVAQGEPPHLTSRVVQFRGISGGAVTTVVTELPGNVIQVELSPDGTRLLAHAYSVQWPSGEIRVTMVSGAGAVLWEKAPGAVFHFSTTGQSLYATSPIGGVSMGTLVTTYDLAGNPIRAMDVREAEGGVGGPVSSKELRGIITVGDGSSIVVATERTARKVVLGTSPAEAWTIDPTQWTGFDFTSVRAFDTTRVVMERRRGGFQIIRLADGSIVYQYDPSVLDANDGDASKTRAHWASYRVYPGPTADTAWLFNGTSNGYTLDLTSGQLTAVGFDASVAPGSIIREPLNSGRVLILGPTQARIRTLSPIGN